MVVASNGKRAFGAARRKQAEAQTAPLVGSTQEQESTQLQTAAGSLGKRHVQRRGTKLQSEDAEEVEELNCKGRDVKKANVPNSNPELEVAAFHVDEYLSRSAIKHANPNSNVIEYVIATGESDGEEAREDDRSRFPRASGEQGNLVEFSSQSRDGAAAVGFQEYILSLDREDTVLAVQGKSSATQNGSLSATHQPHNCNRRTRASVQQYGLRRGRSISPTRRASGVERRSRCQDEKDRPRRRYPKAYYDKKEKGPISSSHRISHVLQDDDTSVHRRTIWRRRSISHPGSHLVKSDSASTGDSISQRDSVIGRETVTIVVIAGPTAVGKSALGIALAKKLGGEIISADSVQVYRGLDVGSAKTAVQERDGIPHHLLDIAFPDAASSYNGKALFARHAWQAVRLVVGRRKTPIVVGGSRMYTCWFIDEAARRGRDCRLLCYAVWKPYDMVYERIDERCEEMVVQGLLQEASWLLDMGVRPSSSSASRAIGYRQAMRFLEESRALDGATSRSRFLAFLTLVQEASRDLARKQLAFFAGDARFQSLNGLRSTEEIVRVVEADVLGDTRHELRQLEKAVKAPWRGQGGEYAHFHHTRLRVFSQLEKCDEVVEWVKRTQRKISTFTEEAVPEIVFEEFSTY